MSGIFPNIIICEQRFPHVSITVWTAVHGSCWIALPSATPRKEGCSIAIKHRTLMVFFKNTASESFYTHHICQHYKYKAQVTKEVLTLYKSYHKHFTIWTIGQLFDKIVDPKELLLQMTVNKVWHLTSSIAVTAAHTICWQCPWCDKKPKMAVVKAKKSKFSHVTSLLHGLARSF